MITVSENAKQHALELIKTEQKPVDTFIRVGVEGGGCSGLSYNSNLITSLRKEINNLKTKGLKLWLIKKAFYISLEPNLIIQEV
jgi:iron-sulfur cluster assembly protein